MYRVILLVVILGITLNAQTWRQVEATYVPGFLVDPEAKGLLIDDQIGWCKNGYLYKTTDGGLNWYQSIPNNTEITKVKFFTSQHGVYSTRDSTYITIDGGDNWLISPTTPPYLLDMEFADSLNGVLSSSVSYYKSDIYYTTDGGSGWMKSFVPNADSSVIWKFQLFENGNGWAFGKYDGGVVLKTTDYGKTWEEKLKKKSVFYGGFFLNENFGVAAGYRTGESLFITHDGGNTWNPVIVSNYHFSKDVYFMTDSLGWCLASDAIFETYDGGITWEHLLTGQFMGFDAEFQNIGFTEDKSIGYAFGSEGVLLVYDTLHSNIDNDLPVSNNFYLLQNFPNPFNPATQITYQIPNDGLVNLKVFNSIGQEIAELVNQYQRSGKYSVDFNGENLSSGVYFCRLQSGDFSTVKKMLLLK